MEPWMEDELVRTIPKEKLDFLEKMFYLGQGKSQKELMGSLLPLMKEAKEKGLTFTPTEMNAAISAIRNAGSAEEKKEIDALLCRAGRSASTSRPK